VTRQRVTAAVGPETRGFGLAAPASDRDADGAGAFGRRLEAAGDRHRQPDHLGHDGAEPAVPETFLETGQHSLLVAAST
jgi:hypothetical protein